MCSILGKRTCSFELEEVPAKRRMVEYDSADFLSSDEINEVYSLFPELESGVEEDINVELNEVEETSMVHENFLLALEGELLLPLLLSVDERRLLANMWISSRNKNHDPFELYDQLQILNQRSLGFLQALGKQRLVKLSNIYTLCTRVTVNLIGSGTKLVLKRTCFDREYLTSLVFDNIEGGEIEFYLGVNKGPDRSLYKLELIFHCPSGDHKIFISDICGAGHKYESGKKILALKQRNANNCVSVILNEETNVKLELSKIN